MVRVCGLGGKHDDKGNYRSRNSDGNDDDNDQHDEDNNCNDSNDDGKEENFVTMKMDKTKQTNKTPELCSGSRVGHFDQGQCEIVFGD